MGVLAAEAVALVVKQYAARAGFLTSGAEAGASIFKSMDRLRGYARRAGLIKDHAGADFPCSKQACGITAFDRLC
jgi:hypothetical protein